MRILLVHQNFPGQYRHLAPALVQRGHQVLALTDRANRNQTPIPTARYRFEPPDKRKVAEAGAPLAAHFAQMVHRAAAAAEAAETLRTKHGFTPDVICAHPGWGDTLFLKAVWPEARQLHYAEFYYAARGQDSDFDPEFQAYSLARAMRTLAMRAHLAQAMGDADAAVAPTRYQADTFPPAFRRLIEVIHDGVDAAALTPDPMAEAALPNGGPTFRHGDELLTFVVRNIEPYRGAHIFLRALPRLLAARPAARVVIVGGDEVSYGAPPPGGGSWKAKLLAELDGRLDHSRIHFTGRVPYPLFCALMRASRVHCYLTYPFVLSWSLLEAMSMGAAVVASDTAPVREVIEDGVNGRLVDFFDVDGLADTLAECLADPEALRPLRRAARATVRERYDLAHCLPRIVDLVERTGAGG